MQTYTTTSTIPYLQQSPFLIDKAKVLKGGKMTLRSEARKSLLKCRYTNSSHSTQRSKSKNNQNEDIKQMKFSQYTEKYRGLETIEDSEDILRFIAYQRIKQSKQSTRGIKLFSKHSRPKTSINAKKSSTIDRSRPSFTSHSTRSPSKKNTITCEVHNSLTQPKKSTIEYTSDNLDERMNQYLNLMLKKKAIDDLFINDRELTSEGMNKIDEGNVQSPKKKQFAKGQYKMLANNFYRRLKKQVKYNMRSTIVTIQNSQGSAQLIKQMCRQRNFNESQGFYQGSGPQISADRANQILRQTTRSYYPSARSTLQPSEHTFSRTHNVSPFKSKSGRSTYRK